MRAAIELMATGERDLESVVQFLVDHSKPAAVRFAEAFQSSVFRLRDFQKWVSNAGGSGGSSSVQRDTA